ncbi:hypothetical protein MCOR34_004423 [Pyricularia oryzae]|nr:hypothetical protein MCOR34_004423 [Pyricularia oryzae]KAI6475229.1 hypothetical protein MCOR17_001661 [Pyricularia oryzae]KAI6497551.1 hypothetical protein MCOR13_006743 [Pyricularia oryzae]
MCANLSEESAIQISDGRPLSRSPEWGDHGGGQPHKQQQQHRQYQPHHRQHPHHHQSNQNYNHNLRHQSTKSAAAKTQDRHQQPAVWTWLNAIGADGARMVTPSHPCSPPTHVPPTDSPEFGTTTTTSSFVRPLVRRRSTLPTNSHMSTHDGNSADASRINFAFDPRQQISTSGVLFGVSELFDWRPPHVDASHKRKVSPPQTCVKCHTTETPEWRNGPAGPGTLCNVCGLVFAKKRARRDRDSWSLDVNNARGGC